MPLEAVQVLLVAPPPIEPAKVTLPPEHTVCGAPALAVAAALTVITTVETASVQGPAGSSVVKVSVTVPLVILGV